MVLYSQTSFGNLFRHKLGKTKHDEIELADKNVRFDSLQKE